MKLSGELTRAVSAHRTAGDALREAGDHKGAWIEYVAALNLLPEPKTDWTATSEILAAIGDVAFRRKAYEKARDALMDAVRCPGGLGNVLIHLRLGQCYLELGDRNRAADNLARAYMGGGREAFAMEDPKYFALVEATLHPPKGTDRLP